ncbi:hypothetical protein N431DRAFT_399931 [Stipitochalara longipes BDJ]|nr:hypothetical protein N431DRAFT_399931 [Stipitochalara longipes BDJ]
MDRVISRMVENSSRRPSSLVVTHGLSFSDPHRHDKGFDYLSTGVPPNLPLGMPISNGKEVLPRKSEPCLVNDVEIPRSFVEKELDHPFFANKIVSTEEPIDSNDSEGSISDTEPSNVSEKDMQTLLAQVRLYFPRKQKALELRAKGWSMVGIFQHLLAASGGEAGLEFCVKLWKLCFFFEKERLLDDALMGFELIQAGYDIEFGAASKETMRCLVHKARVLRKMKEHPDSEAVYRQAIAGFRALRQRSSQLKCQLILGNFLLSLDRDAEALEIFVGASIEHFNLSNTFAGESGRVIELLDSIQRVHFKMELGPDLAENISRLKEIQQQWIENPNPLRFWTEFLWIGSQYSKLEKFELADLCFAIPAPTRPPRIDQTVRIQLVKSSTELSMHYKRQGKLVKSIEQLDNALQHFSTLLQQKSFERTDFQRIPGMTDAVEQELFVILWNLLVELKPGEMPAVHDSYKIPPWSMWRRAEATWAKLNRRAIQHKPIRNSRIDHLREYETNQRRDNASISSHGSSGLSSGSSGSRIGITYSVGSASSVVSNSVFMVPS